MSWLNVFVQSPNGGQSKVLVWILKKAEFIFPSYLVIFPFANFCQLILPNHRPTITIIPLTFFNYSKDLTASQKFKITVIEEVLLWRVGVMQQCF